MKAPKKSGRTAEAATPPLLELIKTTTITSLFSDDDLFDLLVLKGGNAMNIIYQVNSRASVDIDFSVELGFVRDNAWPKIQETLRNGFAEIGYLAFDLSMSPRPGKMPEDLASFWGGYLVEFKLISLLRANEVGQDVDIMRREAINLGQGTRFTVDISRYEYVEHKEAHELDNYTIYVYSPEMIVSEKLRAICQQMEEYANIIKRKGLGNQRARDFVDIEALMKKFDIDLSSERVKHLIEEMFKVKRVPITLLGQVADTRELHATGYDEVRATMSPGSEIRSFDYYFDFVIEQLENLKSLWNV
ncbi:nucleotidyl transferase AbiEii/AbiGii toxin family protein [Allopusillimonas ginsengisoli]|uniref:nucleotidyl transferase AbiEii/AbiGii toxin family protein n=1 Tax=Allopusillimonas ginsengisoli TaxID=453575 RepID=UPI0010212F82|nr:nucleotidyl transferase AbiEii/AbiGii toxin family protein [Allopusillimonas ginsengisoli]TEA78770.1 nucleotidyl transferase AbiEii/AbiGii toxin family protein [Allopusillimonas ginsengisoli]